MAITKETVDIVWKRAGHRCEGCGCILLKGAQDTHPQKGDLHHRYFKSQYKMDDRDEAWNLSLLCHWKCHSRDKEGVHGFNYKLDKKLKRQADIDKPKHLRSATKAPQVIVKSSKAKLAREKAVRQADYQKQKAELKLQQDSDPEFQRLKQERKEKDRAERKRIAKEKDDWFRKKNDGLSPSQLNYRRQKARKKANQKK